MRVAFLYDTEAEYLEELALLKTRIRALIAQETSSYSHQGRQVVFTESSSLKLQRLRDDQRALRAELDRFRVEQSRGGSGIRVRFGVLR